MNDQFDPKYFGLHLKSVRQARGLSVRAAASEIGVEKSTVSRIERGFRPSVENYHRVRKWLDLERNR